MLLIYIFFYLKFNNKNQTFLQLSKKTKIYIQIFSTKSVLKTCTPQKIVNNLFFFSPKHTNIKSYQINLPLRTITHINIEISQKHRNKNVFHNGKFHFSIQQTIFFIVIFFFVLLGQIRNLKNVNLAIKKNICSVRREWLMRTQIFYIYIFIYRHREFIEYKMVFKYTLKKRIMTIIIQLKTNK